ncbi:MAG: cytochrome C biosynthesis protein [Peptoniphilus sp.]|nr:cytochrome C biosynthesis protein [Peptoniphilus sp.]
MRGLLDMILQNDEYLQLSTYAIVAAIVVTFVVNFATRKLKFAKYIPGIILVFIGIFSFFTVIEDLFNPDNIEILVVFVIACASGLISLLFALIIGIIQNDLS